MVGVDITGRCLKSHHNNLESADRRYKTLVNTGGHDVEI